MTARATRPVRFCNVSSYVQQLLSSEAKPAPAGKLSTHGSAPLPSTPADSGANKEDIDTNNTQQAPAPAGSPPLKGCENDEDCAEPAHLDVEANPTGSDSDPVFDPSVLRAEEQAEKLRKASAPQKPAKELTGDNVKALDVLLDKAAIFSNFVKDGINDQIATLNQTDEPAPEDQVGKKRKKRSPAKPPTQTLLPSINPEMQLREYQLKGVAWIIALYQNGMNGILADQMGLGKTAQTIGFLSHLRDHKIWGPFLVVAPLATLTNWQREIEAWCPSMTSVVYHGDQRKEIAKKWLKRDHGDMPVIITTPGIVRADIKVLSQMSYKYLVVDEAHSLKNCDCQLVQKLKMLTAANKLLLTGTPLQNNLAELWSLLNFILPKIFDSVRDFDAWFDFSGVLDGERDGMSADVLEQEAKSRMVSKLHEVLKPFLLRRVKEDVEKAIPAKQEITLYAPLTETQRKLQDSIMQRTIVKDMDELAQSNGVKRQTLQSLHNMLVQLRKNCNHPDILTASSDQSPMFPPADRIVEQGGKFQLLERLLVRLKAGGHKVLIFSQSTRLLDLMDSYIDERGHTSRRLDGSTSLEDRTRAMDEFNGDPACFVMLLSTRAGGTGVNLMSADTVIFYDSDWNPQQDLQAMDRAHRIGQTRPVLVLRLCTSDSVEVRLLRRAHSKLALANIVIKKGAFGGGGDADTSLSLNQQDLLDVIQSNAADESHAQNATVSDEMLEKLLDRTHLAAKAAPPYPASGPGYELVAAQAGGLLSSVD